MPRSLRCVVFATGKRAIPSLEALREGGHEIVKVVSRAPDPEHDGLIEDLDGPFVADWAREQGLDVDELEDPASDDVRSALEELAPDLGIVVAFGDDLPATLREVPERGWIKAHFSLLPKHRGLYPIRSALWNGSRKAGVTIIEVDEQPDAGAILAKEDLKVDQKETYGELADRLEPLGARMLAATVDNLAAGGKIKRRKQNEKVATSTPTFGRRHLKAPWWREAKVVFNHLRALTPEPGMLSSVRRHEIKVVWGEPMGKGANAPFGEAGTFIGARAGQLAILCGGSTVFGIRQLTHGDGTPTTPTDLVNELDLTVGDLFV